MSAHSRPNTRKASELVKIPREERMGCVIETSGMFRLIEVTADSVGGVFRFVTSAGDDPFAQFKDGETLIVPPAGLKSFWRDKALYLPSVAIRNVTAQELIAKIKVFIGRYASVPDAWLDPVAHYILMSWVFDRFTALPYLRFLGESGTGKTRMLEICQSLCYRAFMASGNITGPALFRSIDLIRGTFLVDEGDFKNSEDWSDIIKVLNNGYTPGKPVVRCNSAKDFTPETFWVYGPKVISTRRRFGDSALERRCLTFETGGQKLAEHVPVQLTPAFEEEALALRNELLGWRFDNFPNITADQSQLRNLEPAVAQVGISLLAVAASDEARKLLTSFLGGYAEEARADSPKGVLSQVLDELKAAGVESKTCGDLAQQMNERGAEFDFPPFTARGISSLLRSLGHIPKHTRSGSIVRLNGDGCDGVTVVPGRR